MDRRILPTTITILLSCSAEPSSTPAEDSTGTTESSGEETNSTASSETGPSDPECGDGIVDADEACDLGEDNGANSPCTPECQINICGDGYAFTDNLELCDDGNDSNTDACLNDCSPASCGDGFLFEGTEDCDPGPNPPDESCSNDCEPQRIMDIAIGGRHVCARLRDGQLRCWGANWGGQLGYGHDNLIGDDELPYEAGSVPLGGRVRQVSAGANHTCALMEGGEVRCWGAFSDGQLGIPGIAEEIGDDELPTSLEPIELGEPALALSSGDLHTCALLEFGRVRCWGRGTHGALGYGSTETIGDDETPADAGDVLVGPAVEQLAAGGNRTCILAQGASGHVRCWGSPILGYGNLEQIGDDETPSDAGNIVLSRGARAVDTGQRSACAILQDGAVQCWGDGGTLGYLAGDVGDDEDPAALGVLELGGPASAIAIGEYHRCVLQLLGRVRCWGYGEGGRLGYGSEQNIGDNETPAGAGYVELGELAEQIFAGFENTCAILNSGALRCWGKNSGAQLGLAIPDEVGDDELPTAVPPIQVFYTAP